MLARDDFREWLVSNFELIEETVYNSITGWVQNSDKLHMNDIIDVTDKHDLNEVIVKDLKERLINVIQTYSCSENKKVIRKMNVLERCKMTKIQKHLDICEKLTLMYVDKNVDYGDSFGDTFNKLGLISAVTRITDKTNRLQSLCVNKQKVKDESIKDTLMDLANYAIMTLIELDSVEE